MRKMDHSNPEHTQAERNQNERDQTLPITGDGRPKVPTFACLIYVSSCEDGKVAARVANLAGFELTAATERDALLRISKQFKAEVMKKTQAGETIAWIDPPPPPSEHERVRSIPVHL
jgi:hypothetical protein